jgi:predicted Zn-dependent peptidase
LSNGQRLITERLDHLRSICLGFWIPAGSRDEPPELAGSTHFIEHLLFKGSQKYSAEEIAQIFDTLGGELNAATSREYVVVYARFLDEHLERALDVVVDMLLTPTFADLDREREVVLEEIAMYEDSPQDLVHDYFAQAVFGQHPLGVPVLGSRESVAGMPAADIRGYYDRYFRFSDMVVAAAGSIDRERLQGLLLKTQAERINGLGLHEHSAPVIEQRRLFVTKETEQMHVCLGGRGLARNDERRYASWVLDSLFGGSLSSRLFQEVREKRGLVYSIYTFSNMYAETGLSGIYFGCRPDRAAQVMETVHTEIERLWREPVGDEEMDRAREHLKGRVILGLESTSSRMTRLGKSVVTGVEILSLDEIAARIDAVTAEQVQELALTLYQPEQMAIAAIGPEEDVFTTAMPAAFGQPGVQSAQAVGAAGNHGG